MNFMNNANDSLVYPWNAGQKALLAFSQALAAINSKFKRVVHKLKDRSDELRNVRADVYLVRIAIWLKE